MTSRSGSPGAGRLHGPLAPNAASGAAERRTNLEEAQPHTKTLRYASPVLLIGFVCVEIGCQIALLSPGLAAARLVIRTTAFAGSLALLLLLQGPRASHPSRGFASVAMAILAASLFHPDTNAVAGVATVLLNLAILGPIFWVPRIRIDPRTLRNLLLLFWTFETLSAILGALQVYFPGSFQPATSVNLSDETIQSLHITLTNGTRVLRPMGLTDTPGGAGIGAAYSLLLAAAFLMDRPKPWFRLILLTGVAVSCFTIYLCQVRSLLLMVILGLIPMAYYASQRRMGHFAATAALISAAAVAAFFAAVSVGGDAVTSRLSTLVESDPRSVYYTNRGIFLEHTLTELLPEYPLGAGLGRWGMMGAYFGGRDYAATSRPIWAEIQWTGWLLDGGVPLILSYVAALFLALRDTTRLLGRRDDRGSELRPYALAFLGYGIGAAAITFDCCPFASTLGIDFWLLSAAVFAAGQQYEPAK